MSHVKTEPFMSTELRFKLLLLVSATLMALLIGEFLLRISGLGTVNGTVMIHDSVLVREAVPQILQPA